MNKKFSTNEILDAVKSNSTMQSIAEKKGIMPVTYKSVRKQIKYLKRNQEKWSK